MEDGTKFCEMCRYTFQNAKTEPPKLLMVIALMCVLIVIIACLTIGSTESWLVGTWYDDDSSPSFAFALYSDGTCKIPNEYGTGKWAVVNEDNLKLTNFCGESATFKISKITGNTLILGYGDYTGALVKRG